MTKTQIWIASALVLFLLLFFLEQVTQKQSENGNDIINPTPQTNLSSENVSPAELINRLGCTNCHGTNLDGTDMGPDLHGLKQYWSRESLVNFLRNPSANLSSDRLKKYKEKYPGVLMPSFENLGVKELGRVSDYLIKLKK